ncbi:MAG: CinA family nicotinamide mononucleotide deamidase-related protein [Holophagales bacterium]|jgi:nicotinamide-nucleotide amidase|nr:CinA family nicotinamide mononucleotide deamidase-related protein [Holophagales bacterium]
MATKHPHTFRLAEAQTRAEIIAVGSELLKAGRTDTNSVWIGERLAELGIELGLKTCVGDERDALKACISDALERSELIITTGGLGPTFDDNTKEVAAEVLGVPMFEDASTRSNITDFFLSRGRAVTENNYKQALIPQGAKAIPNPLGTAPGVYWKDPPSYDGRRIVMLPGVPREMMALWTNDVHPLLLDLANDRQKTLRFVVSGAGESALDERTNRVRARHSHLDWSILAPRSHVEFLVRSTRDEDLEALRRDMEAELGMDLVCVGPGSQESVVLDMLAARNETLALAESVTGGILASRLVDVPGASRAFLGGVVAYTPKAKTELLGLSADFIVSHGTVGEAVAREMAARVKEKLGADWGLAVTGNAGPDADKNALNRDGCDRVGRCYIALAGDADVKCQTRDIHGDRPDVQFRAANWAIDMLRRGLF